ncbi:8-oxo-dGTP diphosphatase [Diplodia seriata]|uniref:8-oxo-dGTP diphosphatase n=1 Tax=Diplodia seriata TaxID=420778 RepID=A0ABR3CA74_9PEZI
MNTSNGRADAPTETPFQTARREAWEEIGLPLADEKLPSPFRVEHLCQMPANLARTELAVRPCVAFLAADRLPRQRPSSSSSPSPASPAASSAAAADDASAAKDDDNVIPTAEDLLIPRLSPHEVAAVFTAPFKGFLLAEGERSASAGEAEAGVEAAGFPAKWYQGQWTDWHESRWRMHNFYVPVGQAGAVMRAKGVGGGRGRGGEAEDAKEEGKEEAPRRKRAKAGAGARGKEGDVLSDPPPKDAAQAAEEERFRVFGMTARILVDAARVAYDEEPRFEHNSHFGDEDMIARLLRMGRLSAERRKGDVLTREVLREAAKL